MDTVHFAVFQVFSCAEDCVCQDFFQVLTIRLSVVFNRILECCAFVESALSELFHSEEVIDITHLNLSSEFHISILFP